ncbi:MAG: hypothetical protein V4649_11825 [Bacteroidota bacterium]
MKKGIVLAAAFLGVTYVVSCTKPSCVAPIIKTMSFYIPSQPASVIPDTSVTVLKATKGKNFTQIAESFPNIQLDRDKSFVIPYKGDETYNFDWQVTLKPSGKTYKITMLEHDDNNPNRTNCVSTVTYRLNDSLVTMQGSPYSMTPTVEPEIKIRYQ